MQIIRFNALRRSTHTGACDRAYFAKHPTEMISRVEELARALFYCSPELHQYQLLWNTHSCRHMGHVDCEVSSHFTRQCIWNACWQRPHTIKVEFYEIQGVIKSEISSRARRAGITRWGTVRAACFESTATFTTAFFIDSPGPGRHTMPPFDSNSKALCLSDSCHSNAARRLIGEIKPCWIQ